MKTTKSEQTELEMLMYDFREKEVIVNEKDMISLAEMLAAEGLTREDICSIISELVYQDQLPN